MDRPRLGALAGIIAPVVFVTVFTIEGWRQPGYDSFSMFVSELSLGPRGFIQTVNFLVYGVLQLLFARGIAAEFPDGTASRAGPVVLGIIGVGMLGGGMFVMDPVPTPLANLSWHGWLHGLSGALVFYGWPISCFIFLRRFREDPRWKALATWTLTAGVVSAALLVMLRVVILLYKPGNAANAWGGLIQRSFVIPSFGWQFAVAVRLYSLTAVS